jgi:hypothetical protein
MVRWPYSAVVSTSQLQPVAYAACRLGETPARIYNIIKAGLLPLGVVVRLGRHVRIDPDALERFIAAGGRALADKDAA